MHVVCMALSPRIASNHERKQANLLYQTRLSIVFSSSTRLADLIDLSHIQTRLGAGTARPSRPRGRSWASTMKRTTLTSSLPRWTRRPMRSRYEDGRLRAAYLSPMHVPFRRGDGDVVLDTLQILSIIMISILFGRRLVASETNLARLLSTFAQSI
jgi:hypothetical protein